MPLWTVIQSSNPGPLSMNKLAKEDLVILMVIFVALKLRGTPRVMDG